jgi:hypothetical protein
MGLTMKEKQAVTGGIRARLPKGGEEGKGFNFPLLAAGLLLSGRLH